MKRLIATLLTSALLIVPLVAVPVGAHEADEPHEHATTKRERLTDEQKAKIREEAKKRIEGRLDAAKKSICEKRVAVITRIMTNAAEMGAKHLAVFDKILTRVQDFYTTKSLSVDNYDALVAAAAGKKAAAQTAIDAVKNNVAFDCNADNPVGKVNAFNGQVRAMHQALKDYRTAVKDVLVAVKQAARTAEGGTE